MCVGKKQDYLNYKEIGKNIRYFRQRAGLKQNELSDRLICLRSTSRILKVANH